MLDDLDLDDFWEHSKYARKEYVEAPLTDALLASVEEELGFKLPLAYVALMRSQNGGIPKRTCFPTETPTSWAEDHVAITGIRGIGRGRTYSLLGDLGSPFMQQEWGYPTFGVSVCTCPSAGHDLIMLDYRECGPEGEPTVIHVDQEADFAVTFLARDFGTFLRGLVHESDYDESEAELAAALDRIESGAFSTSLARAIAQSPDPARTDRALRGLLGEVAREKGFLALHADPLSHLVYDVVFDLHSTAQRVPDAGSFLDAYKGLLALGDGELTTGGYAPGFVREWLEGRRARMEIIEHDGALRLSDTHREAVATALARFE